MARLPSDLLNTRNKSLHERIRSISYANLVLLNNWSKFQVLRAPQARGAPVKLCTALQMKDNAIP